MDKFDLNTISEYLAGLMQHINSKSKGDIDMVFIISSNKNKEIDYMMPKAAESCILENVD